MKLSAPPPPPPPSDGNPGAGAPGTPDEQPNPNPAPPVPEAPTASAPAPATLPAPKPAVWPAWYSGFDAALVGLVVAFALASASFVARNSDLWVNLAAGKRLFAGEYFPGGKDPLSYSAAGRTWVNHSWLADAAAYLLYGGSGQVLLAAKAVLVALTFGLLMAIRRPNFALWPWAAVACVGVLACAPRFDLRPLVVSMLLFATTLFILFRMPRGQDHPKRFLIAIGVTFWIWANCDQWFFVGPLALALLLVGELIQKYGFNSPDEAPETPADEPLGRLPNAATLAKALGIGVLACTLTPHHVQVWELPFELTGAPGIGADLRLKNVTVGPTDSLYRSNAGLGYNLNGLAFVVLFTAGATVFGLGPARVRVAHVALWVGLAALSLVSIYTVPFFVLAAVPLVAAQLNAFSAQAELKTWGDPKTRMLLGGSSVGRVLSALTVCALVVLTYPGWTHPDTANPVYARRVAWAVEPDPAMVRVAEQFSKWRESGALPDEAHGFVANIELANHLAWFAPKEKVFINGRLNHHRPELPDYITVRKGLGLSRVPDEEPNPDEATAVLKARGAEYIALHTGAGDLRVTQFLTQLAARWMIQHWGDWSVWYLDGHTDVFGWRGDGPKSSFAELALDPVARAFGPSVTKVPAPELTQPLKEVDPLVEAFGRAPRAAPPGAAEARAWLEYKAALRGRAQLRQQLTAELFFFAPAFHNTFHQPFLFGLEERGELRFPAGGANPEVRAALLNEAESVRAIPLLAVRAARRAIAEDPDHPDAYYALGMALSDPDLPLTEGERSIGRITAFKQCLVRLPRPERYKPRQFATTATDAALNLAQAYLGRRFAWRDPTGKKDVVEYSGFSFPVAPFQAVLGGQPLFGERNGTVSRGRGGPGAVPLNNGNPYLLPIDLARETLQLALDYAPLDLTDQSDDQIKAKVKQVEDFRREVEDVAIRYKGRYDAGVARGPKLPERVLWALQTGMLGEAMKLLSDDSVDLEKEYGRDHALAIVQRVSLELVTGQVENAADILKALSAPDKAGALEQSGIAVLVQTLKYQKAILAGEYQQAGKLWESLWEVTLNDYKRAGDVRTALLPFVGRLDTFPPLGPNTPKPTVLSAIKMASGTLTPETALGKMLVPPLGPTIGHAQLFQTYFWIGSWDVPRQFIQQAIAQLLASEAGFFTRCGALSLLEGDIPVAKERFRTARRKAPPGWGLRDATSAEAELYLQLIEHAEKGGR